MTEVADAFPIDMASVLAQTSMWLVLEGFTHGYASTEAAVDALHTLIHNDLAERLEG